MGSIVTYDRRGEILWMNDFSQGGQPYVCSGIGVGEGHYLSCGLALSGGISLVLMTGGAAADYEQVYCYSYCPFEGGIGEEIWFHPEGNLSYLTVRLLLYYLTARHDYRLKYDDMTGKLSIWDAMGAWVEIGDSGVVGAMLGGYVPIKLVIDPTAHRYARVMFMDRVYTPVGYGPQIVGGVYTPQLMSEVRVVAELVGGLEVAVDNWILTQNEPVT